MQPIGDTIKGAIKSTYDIRDYWYSPKAAGETTFAFDVEDVLGKKLIVKDQNGSFSCGGQAWAYYGEVLEAIATGNYEPRSARWIYAHTAAPGGGSRGKDNSDFVVKNGFVQEKYATSYENGKAPKEPFMLQKPILSKEAIEEKDVSKVLSYLKVPATFDAVSDAIKEHNGCILMIAGQDNGTWKSKFPQPPMNVDWYHWIYAGKLKVIKGRKHIGFVNSWGYNTGEDGWQWIDASYFEKGNIPEAWTLAWDYRPAKVKVLMQEVIKLLEQLVLKLK